MQRISSGGGKAKLNAIEMALTCGIDCIVINFSNNKTTYHTFYPATPRGIKGVRKIKKICGYS